MSNSDGESIGVFPWLVFVAFLLDAYIPDPLPLVDEIGLGALLCVVSKELAVLAIIIMAVLFFTVGWVPMIR